MGEEEEEEKYSDFLSWFQKAASEKYKKINRVTKRNVNECRANELKHCAKKQRVDMNKGIVVPRVFILSTIQGSWLFPPPTFPTPWMDGNSDLKIAGGKHAAGLLIGFLWRK